MKRSLFSLVAILFLAGPVLGQAADARQDFLKLIDRPLVPLAPESESLPAAEGLTETTFSFATEASQRVPGILFEKPGQPDRRPVVIVMHGTGGRKEDEQPLLRRLAEKGFVAVAIDGRYHGQRAGGARGATAYQAAIVRAWHGSGEHPLYYDTVWDARRLVDYVETRADVDARRIGLAGFSKGGIETYLTAAADPRIAVAVPMIGAQSFHWALAHDGWHGRIATIQNAFNAIAAAAGVTNVDSAFVQKFYDRIIPGIYGEFDGPPMISLIAPRPLLIINGDRDPNCPLPGVMECAAAAHTAYHAAQADDHLHVIIQKNTAHQVRPEAEQAMIDWFVKWLKP